VLDFHSAAVGEADNVEPLSSIVLHPAQVDTAEQLGTIVRLSESPAIQELKIAKIELRPITA